MKKRLLIYMIATILLVVAVPIGLMLWHLAHPSKSVFEEIYDYTTARPTISWEQLETLYETKPYDQLLPHTKPQGFTLETAQCERKRGELTGPIQALYLQYIREDGSTLSVTIDEYYNANIANPLRPETYSLKIYYEESHKNSYYYSYSHSGLFYPEDITLETVAARIYSGERLKQYYACHAQVGVLIDRQVHISYSYYGSIITPEELYEMITSAKYFQK